jgi:cytidylate kinase
MYRAVTWRALQLGIDSSDAEALGAMAERASIDVRDAADGAERTQVVIDGIDATPHLRSPAVEANVSLVSRVPAVRAALVRVQRDLARDGRMVMAGRDIGTVVLPDASLKVYLEASDRVRAERRARQARASGGESAVDEMVSGVARRDRIDSTRETSPLTAADDAVIINTDDMTVDDVVARILDLTR